jgi:hypothetical protein
MPTGLSTVRLPEICELSATGWFWPELPIHPVTDFSHCIKTNSQI